MTRNTGRVGVLALALVVALCGTGDRLLPSVSAQNQLPKGSPKALQSVTNSTQTVVGTGAILDLAQCYNPNASVAYLQLFNVASATSVTVGTTVPTQSYGINATSQLSLQNVNAWYGLGLKVAATTAATNATAPGTAIDCNFVIR